MSKKQENRYYSLDRIKKKKAVYNVIFGERSNGKTYATLKEGLENYVKTGGQIAYVRRWKEDVTGKRASGIWNSIIQNGEVERLTKGEFKGIHYYAGKFYLCNYEKGKVVYSEQDIIGYTFALSDNEHNKSVSYPRVERIIFDEFLTKHLYLQDEFVLFMNTVSTIVRQRTNVIIYMLGNTVNKYCPYFQEMGLNHVLKMEQGTIDVYKYGDSKLSVAVEYCASTQAKKANNFYFAFDNPKLEMITGGAWELNIYPHCPVKFKPKDIQFIYFILFNDNVYQCEIVSKDNITFTYIHIKTTELQNDNKDLIYTLEYVPKMNYNRNIYKPINKLQEKVLWYFQTDRVYYQNNEIGDAINNYLKICKRGG